MTGILIRPNTLDDDARTVEIGNRIYREFPPMSVEDLRFYIENRPKDSVDERYVAEKDGAVVGFFALREMWWSAERGMYSVRLNVDPNHQRQGIGSRLYDVLLERVLNVGARRLRTNVRDDQPVAERFALKRGFQKTGRVERESRLNVHSARLDGYDGLEERLRAEGIRIATLAELGADDEAVVHSVHELSDRAARDVPSSFEFTSTPCEQWHREVLSGPGMSPDWFWVALDGERPVGLALLKREGENAAYNDFTATDREYRGRGIARALKKRTIDWARRNGVDYIYTGNDAANERMLAINLRLGYEPLPTSSELVKTL